MAWTKNYTPEGGGGSRAEGAFLDIVDGDCAAGLDVATGTVDEAPLGAALAEPERSLFIGVASACLGAFGDRTDLWSTAETSLASLDPHALNCWYAALLVTAQQLVAAHRADPSTVFVLSGEDSSFACPFLRALDPSHGDAAGGYDVRITGSNLPVSLELSFGGSPVTARRQSDGTMLLTVPQGSPVEVLVTVAARPARGFPPSLSFTYDPSSSASDPVSASESTRPPASSPPSSTGSSTTDPPTVNDTATGS